jgi:hypothetical protein
MAGFIGSSQNHLDIIDIKDDVLVLKGGRYRIVLEAQAINFDLLSEAEQDAAIYSYANLINSLDFPMQVVIRTRQVDITEYIGYLDGFRKLQPTATLRQQLDSYMQFVRDLVSENTVLYKKFYVIIPHMGKAVEQSSGFMEPIMRIFGKEEKIDRDYSQKQLDDAQKVFAQRTKELIWQFRRLGIGIRQLTTEELIRLYYEIYNPETGQNDGLQTDLMGYTSTIIKPSVA